MHWVHEHARCVCVCSENRKQGRLYLRNARTNSYHLNLNLLIITLIQIYSINVKKILHFTCTNLCSSVKANKHTALETIVQNTTDGISGIMVVSHSS